jgi:hypothetical protein
VNILFVVHLSFFSIFQLILLVVPFFVLLDPLPVFLIVPFFVLPQFLFILKTNLYWGREGEREGERKRGERVRG